MVNTFLPYESFEKSAQALDNRRLGKQRSEAVQILNILEDLEFLSKELDMPMPTELPRSTTKTDPWHKWILAIISKYQNLPYRYAKIKLTRMQPIPIDIDIIKQYGLTSDTYTKVPLSVMYTLKRYKNTSIRIINKGHCYHPLVKMWIGYNDALKHYINCVIHEWINRGNDNNMYIYPVPSSFKRPPWTYNPKVHENHRAALIDKEISRNEKPWYIHMSDFKSLANTFVDYMWVIE